MKTIPFLLLLIFTAPQLVAQQSKADSLLEQLPHATDKGPIYKALVYEFADNDNPRAYQYCLKFYQLRLQSGDTSQIVSSGRLLAQILRRLDKFDSCKILLLKLLPVARRHQLDFERVSMLNVLSITYSMGAQYDKALSCLFECVRIPELSKHPDVESAVYHHMGFNYYKLSNYDKGIEYSMRALAIKKANNISFMYDNIHLNVSLCHMYKGEFEEAQKIIDEVITSAAPDRTDLLMELAFNSGQLSVLMGDTSRATEHFTRSMQYAMDRGDVRFELDNINILSQLYLKKKELNVAGNYLDQAQKLVAGTNYKREIINLNRRLSEYNKLKGNYKDALYYHEKANELHESVYGSKTTNNVLLLESEYVEFENAARIAEQAQLISLKDDVIRWQYFTIAAVALILMLALIILYGLYKNHQQKKLANHALEELVKERTKGFAASIADLQQQIIVREQKSKKLIQEIHPAMNAVGALCYLIDEDQENKTHYVADIRKLSEKVVDAVASYQVNREGMVSSKQ